MEKSFQESNLSGLGMGTWGIGEDASKKKDELAALRYGLDHGIKVIDTAEMYGEGKSEKLIGEAIRGYDRSKIFLISKFYPYHASPELERQRVEKSLKRLGTDYLDLYLIHWPNPLALRDHWAEANAESWRAMEEAVKAGKIRAIGVSNFRKHHLEELLKTAEIKPVVNQIMLNPSDLQSDVVKVNKELGLLSEAYSPLGTGGLLGNEVVNEIANEVGKSPAQVLIRWSLEHGFLPLPKSVHDKYIAANIDVFDFELNDEQMSKLDSLHGVSGLATDPDTASF